MAKGSNSLRSKKSHSSKPYDVSNSFVKKVSSLLPHPAWLTKWLAPPVPTPSDVDSESEEETAADESLNLQPPPVKRAKISLNRPLPANSFRVAVPSSSQGLLEQPSENATSTPIRSVFEDAVAGPSGLASRSHPTATSAFPSPVVHSTNLEAKLNGDGGSDSSESTSGCSSLVPQANRQMQGESLAARRRSIDENLSLTNHLQSPRSLFPSRMRSPRFTPSMSRRRPSFNVSAFGSPILDPDKSICKDKDTSLNSPFYSGRTMYGGASAYRRPREGISPSELIVSKRAVQVRPVNAVKDSAEVGMSHTARRILEALEQFSTPVMDAKRMPLLRPAYVPPLCSKRKHPVEEAPLMRRQGPGPVTRQLTIPTVPDILKMRRREQLQDTMEAARRIATSEPYCIRSEDDGDKVVKYSGKVSKANPLDEEMLAEEVNLPNIALPITSLPKFDIMVPPAPLSVSSNFTFAPPITITGGSRTLKSTNSFTFSKPLSANRTDRSMENFLPSRPNKLEVERKPSHVGNISANKVVVSKNNGQNNDVGFGIKPATELKSGSDFDILGKKENSVNKDDTRNNTFASVGFGLMFKPSADTWECNACMIRNQLDAVRCIACETPRPQPKTAVTASTTASPLPGFGGQFKLQTDMWECPSCMVRNKESETACVACAGAKPGLKAVCQVCLGKDASGSQCQACLGSKPIGTATVNSAIGFGDKFRRPEGCWDCPVCMIPNQKDNTKCSACHEPKPGSVKPPQPSSTIKFNFPIPPEASTFKFGMDKAGDKVMAPVVSDSVKGFKFGESITSAPAVNFKFGISAPVSETNASKLQVTVPATSVGILATTAASHTSGVLSSVGAVSSTSATASPSVVFAKPAVPSKKAPFTSDNTQSQSKDISKPSTKDDSKKRPSSDVADSSSDSKGFKFGGLMGGPAVSTSETKRAEKKPLSVEPVKKVEASNVRKTTPPTEAKPTFTFVTPSSLPNTSTVASPVKPVATTAASPNFNLIVAPSSSVGVLSTNSTTCTTTTTTTTTSMSSIFSFGKGATVAPAFGTGVKTSTPGFTFGANSSPGSSFKSRDDSSAIKKQAVTFNSNSVASGTVFGLPANVPTTTTATPASASFGSPLPTLAVCTGSSFGAGASTVPSFGVPTTAPSFSSPITTTPTFGTASTKPSFTTPSSSTSSFSVPTTTVSGFVMPTTTPSFGTAATPTFGSEFSSTGAVKQPSVPSSTTAPFIFGSNPSSGTASAAFPFSGTQASSTLPAATAGPSPKVSGFNFGASSSTTNPTPGFGGFNFSGSSSGTSAGSSVFGVTSNNAPSTHGNPVFGSAPTASFGANTAGGSFSAPTFNFGAGSQPFGFTGSQASSVQPAQNSATVAPSFTFSQLQNQPTAPPTFNPNVRPTFNFTGGETPQFTAAAPANTSGRRIKKAVRRTIR